MEVLFFKTQAELSVWFSENFDKIPEQWIGYYKKATQKESINWEESVEVAISYGWIDGIRKSIDKDSYANRFTPRRAKSNWSLKNIKTAESLINRGLMMPSGLKAFNLRKEERIGVYSFENKPVAFNNDFENKFKENKTAWLFFGKQADYYKKTAMYWVMSAKLINTQEKRLQELIKDSENLRNI